MRTTVAERIGADVAWDGAGDPEVRERVAALLAEPLGPDEAVQVAVLHNAELQAALDELGIRNAELIEASLLPNPHAEGMVGFGHGEEPDLHGSLALSLSELVFTPIERGIASARLEAATFDAAGRVLDVAFETRVAFYRYLAARQLLGLDREVLESAFLAFDAARRLHEAGNMSDLELAEHRALYEEARLAVAEGEVAVVDRREDLQVLMGLWGELAEWEAIEELPPPPEEALELDDAESAAVERSLELAELRARWLAEARRHDLSVARGVVPELRAGVAAEREDGEWEVGPEVELEIPLFDQGQGETAAAEARLARIRHEYTARAVRVRSAARAARFRLEVARQRVAFYRERLVPLRERITELTLQHYNAMFASVFDLLAAKRAEIRTAREYIGALRDYWIARATLEQILAGRTARREEPLETLGAAEEAAGPHGGGGGH